MTDSSLIGLGGEKIRLFQKCGLQRIFVQVVISWHAWPESIGDLQDIDRDGMRVQGRSWIPLLWFQSLPNMTFAPPLRE